MTTDKRNALTAQDLAEAYIFPHGLTEKEKTEADVELKLRRLKRLNEMSDQQRVYGELLGLKYRMEDYLEHGKYAEATSFGAFLQQYLRILGKKQRDFAAEISLHHTKLNQVLSGRAAPNLALAYRLEKHSGGLLPALLWWRTDAKKTEAAILNDLLGRQQEGEKVRGGLQFH